MSSSERTSHSVTSGLDTVSASSRTLFSIRSPWKVNASCAPSSASRRAIAHAIERLLATPRTSPRLPSNLTATRASPISRPVRSCFLRRLLAFALCSAALASAAPAAAGFQPVRRTFGEVTLPRVRAGRRSRPARARRRGRVRVIVALRLPPLAAAFRRLEGRSSATHLDARSASSRAYLARLDAAQKAAVAQLRRTIPEARVQHRYRVVFDGLAVSLPARKLPALMHLSFARHVYPSVRFTLALNRSPSVIGADVLRATTGANGEGVKIGVVDDGVDPTNPFFSPAGFSYPAGFPKGGTKWTTPKVIVARVFPGPNAGAAGRMAVDRKSSFHATHVAGIAAGDAGTTATPGRDHPLVRGLSGVAPRAWIGNYRVFTVPTPIGHVANTPEIVEAFESAVADGMDVINFSGGGPQTDPANDAMIETIRNVAAAGVVPVISAGNDRDDFGSAPSARPAPPPTRSPSRPSRTARSSRPRSAWSRRAPRRSSRQVPFALGAGGLPPPSWGQADQTLVDVGSIVGRTGNPGRPLRLRPGQTPNPAKGVFRRAPLGRDRARLPRQLHLPVKGPARSAAGAIGIVLVDNRPGEANGIPIPLRPAGMISDLDGARLTAYLGTTGGRTTVRIGRDYQEILTGRSGVMTSFSSAGPTSVRPPAEARRRGARRPDPLLDAAGVRAARSPSSTGRAWRPRTSRARRRCSSSAIRAGRRSRSSRR